MYEKSFDVFCQKYIQENIIAQGKVYSLQNLLKKFTVQREEQPDVSSYKSERLKAKILNRFSSVVFH